MSGNEIVHNFNILILGDGNFSFSLSLLNRLQTVSKQQVYQITATSFDSQEEIRSKYPDSIRILSDFNKDQNVSVLHDVDATKIETYESLKRRCIETGDSYSDIIFNFPHLGKEDCIAHSSLLAHIMHRFQ